MTCAGILLSGWRISAIRISERAQITTWRTYLSKCNLPRDCIFGILVEPPTSSTSSTSPARRPQRAMISENVAAFIMQITVYLFMLENKNNVLIQKIKVHMPIHLINAKKDSMDNGHICKYFSVNWLICVHLRSRGISPGRLWWS